MFEAKRYIPRGTPRRRSPLRGLLKPVQVPVTQAVAGRDHGSVGAAGEVSSAPIAADQQVTASDFSHATPTISAYLTAISELSHSRSTLSTASPPTSPGRDTVDVMVLNGGKTEMVDQNVTVLANAAGDVVLRLTDKQALLLSAATRHGSLWLTLRPAHGAKDSVQVGSVGTS